MPSLSLRATIPEEDGDVPGPKILEKRSRRSFSLTREDRSIPSCRAGLSTPSHDHGERARRASRFRYHPLERRRLWLAFRLGKEEIELSPNQCVRPRQAALPRVSWRCAPPAIYEIGVRLRTIAAISSTSFSPKRAFMYGHPRIDVPLRMWHPALLDEPDDALAICPPV